MRDDDRLFYAQTVGERYGQFVKDLPTLVARLREMRGGYPSGGLNGSGGGSPDTQPERMAGQSDKADADLGRVDRLVLEVHSRVAELDNIRLSTMPRRGTPDVADEGCRSCARAGGYSSVDRPESGLCRWCYDRKLELEREPPVIAVRWHLDGRRVSQRDMQDALSSERLEQEEAADAVRKGKDPIKRKRDRHRRKRGARR